MAAVYPTNSLIVIFEDLFPNFKDSDNVYYMYGTNSIKIVNTIRPTFIFKYESNRNWELITAKREKEQDSAMVELRKQLTIAQERLVTEKRRKSNV